MNFSGAPGFEFGSDSPNVDSAVLEALPKNCRVLSTRKHGVSFWAESGRIKVQLEDDTKQSFFIKVITNDNLKGMFASEFESARTIYKQMPDFVPLPVAVGSYKDLPSTHFILFEFKDFEKGIPDKEEFTARLAQLHSTRSPNGKFGFHMQLYIGCLPNFTSWEDSWEVFFTKYLQYAFDQESRIRGFDPVLADLVPVIMEKVVPRLIRPLESDGRKVTPSLIHGDLWFANSGKDKKTGKSVVFDACCVYAHNEFEFGQWTSPGNQFGDEYIEAYQKHIPPSEPVEDFRGRVDLYRLQFWAIESGLFADDGRLHARLVAMTQELIERYGQ